MELVYRYGVASWWQAPPEVMEQLWLGHQLDNRLVAVNAEHEQGKAAHWGSFPDVAEHEQALAAATDEVAAARRQVAAARQRLGAAKHDGADKKRVQQAEAELREQQAALREATARVKKLRARRRETIQARVEESQAALAALEQQRRDAIAGLYAEFCQGRGLHWATYGRRVKQHEQARMRVAAVRAGAGAAQMRFRPWDGTGAVTVQLQRQAWSHGCAEQGPPWPCATPGKPRSKPAECPQRRPRDPVRSPALLASGGGKWRNVFQLRPWVEDTDGWKRRPRSARRGTAILGLSGGRRVEVPVLVDRMLPAEADVPMVELVRSRRAGRLVWHLCVTVVLPDPPPRASGPAVAVHLGWRARRDGNIRVGVIQADGPLPAPPDDLLRPASRPRRGKPHHRPYLERHDGWWEVVVPAQLWDLVGRPEAIRSRRDQAFNKIRDRLAGWLEDHPDDAEALGVELQEVKAWRSPRRLAGLVRQWDPSPHARARGATAPDLPAGFAAGLLPDLVAWWRRDLHLMRNERGERHDLRARRDDVWRQVGAWLGAHAGRLVVGDEDYRKIRRRPGLDDDVDGPLPTVAAAEAVRARAAFVAPGLLRAALAGAAARRGVPVVKVPAKGLTREHAGCGHVGQDDPQYAAGIVVTCPGCGEEYDQDVNAVGLMLGRERSGGGTTAG